MLGTALYLKTLSVTSPVLDVATVASVTVYMFCFGVCQIFDSKFGLCHVFLSHTSHFISKVIVQRPLKNLSHTSQNWSSWSQNDSKCQEVPDQLKTHWCVPDF